MIRVLIVEDSAVIRELLAHILRSDPAIEVMGTARSGEEALEAVERAQPDLITMDIHMPGIDGLETTRRIMETCPVPIVIVSGSSDPDEVAITFRAMEAGALAVLRRPAGIGHPEHEKDARELIQTVILMSEVKVVRRWPRMRRDAAKPVPPSPIVDEVGRYPRIVALAASTGGPPVLQTILSALPAAFPLPVLVVQHMAEGFTEAFVGWLARSCRLPVHVALQGELILPGHVYFAPDGLQMRVTSGGRIDLARDERENGVCPSASVLFRSIGEHYGGHAAAGLLTGMGSDGAEDLLTLRKLGAVTFAQDQASSVVHGMPGEAIRLGAAALVLAPERIAAALISLAMKKGEG
ncbi:MAG TPA: chemotaxis-specific protein-glutamate methyltransferase CheB [Thermoanaerobaculia bacterium]|nr:chemotaxis-specific protein-glutamate methyltransferase CheB [Thermoanaerobaculia bacterium]